MFHTDLKRYEKADIDSFANIGLHIRKVINPLWRRALRLGTKRKLILEIYPKLDKNKTYIFAINHFFDGDIEQRSHIIKDKVLRKKFIKE